MRVDLPLLWCCIGFYEVWGAFRLGIVSQDGLEAFSSKTRGSLLGANTIQMNISWRVYGALILEDYPSYVKPNPRAVGS